MEGAARRMSQRYLKRANWEIYLFDKKWKTSILTFIEFQNQARLVWYKGQEKVIAEIIGGGDHSHSSRLRQQDINQIVGWSHPHQPPSYKSFGQSLVIPSKHVIYKKVASDSLKFTQASLAIFLDEVGKIGFQGQAWLDSAASCVSNIRRLCYICLDWSWFSFNNPFSKWTGYMIHVIRSKKTRKKWRLKWQPNGQHPPAPCPCAAQHLRCIPGSRSSSNVTVRKFQRSIKRWEGCRSLRRRRHHPQNPKSLYTPRFCESYKHNPSF